MVDWQLSGWRLWLAAFALGAGSVLAMPPVGLWWVLFATFPALVLLIDGAAREPALWRRCRSCATVGWWFGFGYLLPGLYWIGAAFLVQAERFAILMPFAILLLPAYLAVYYGLATGAAAAVWSRGPQRLLALAVTIAAGEWLRGHCFTGFPWNAVGYGLTISDALAQNAALFGVTGLSFWAVLLFSSPVLLVERGDKRFASRVSAAACAALLLAGFAWGNWRLAQPALPDEPGIRLRLVQPNIPEKEKFETGSQRRIFDRMIELSRTNAAGQVDNLDNTSLLIWPEEPLNFLMLDTPEALAEIAAALNGHVQLLTGAFRAEADKAQSGSLAGRRIYNSLAVIDPDGKPTAVFDKIHLVPWGEYLPYQELLEAVGLHALSGASDTPGTNPRRLVATGVPPFSPLICYEAIFPGEVVEPNARPRWLLNITNDAWFGEQTGPYQHFHQARMRAIEEGLPLVRVAITGISAIVDARGTVRRSLLMSTAGVIDGALPAALPTTPYARLADGILLMQLLIASAAIVLIRLAEKRARG